LALVEAEAQRVTICRDAFRADQFYRDGNWKSHYATTAREIWEATQGQFNAFVDFVGSGGSFTGISKYIKERDGRIECHIVEPAGAAALSGALVTDPQHPIQGGGYGYSELAFLKQLAPDGYLQVRADEVVAMARNLARLEGVFGGFSGGANCAAAVDLLRTSHQGGTVVFLVCDSGLKYLSTELWPVGFQTTASELLD
jgi:cysteine synthase A